MKTSGKISELSGCSVRYLDWRTYHSARPDWGSSVASSSFLSQRLNSSRNLYRKDLYAHYGCVNAIEFSHEGDLLVSGGDDRRVLLWNVESALSNTNKYHPRSMKGEHNSNIFCLSFDSNNTRIFSAGNDEQVIVHDLKTGDSVDVFLHREAVYGVTVSPTCDSVFASAGEDGQVLLYDMREPASTDPVCLARYHDAFHAVQFHPTESSFVVTANSREGVSLWDVRKPRVPVLRYGEKRCAQSSICARFNRTGSQIIALRRRLPPVLYNTHNSKPVCQFDAEHYYNSCTMKSCCFAGDSDQFVLSGSDDFNLYMWKIPDGNNSKHIVSEAHMVLRGHRSIVNEVRFNPQNFIIASSGVEKIVKLWSGLSMPGFKGNLVRGSRGSSMTRRVYTHEEYIGLVLESGQVVGDVNHDYSHGSTDEDPRMMAFFDSLVQREVEGWTSNTDLSDDTQHPLSGPDDDDTTTTTQSSLSLPTTSQSDDNDSDDDGGSGGGGGGRGSPEERPRGQQGPTHTPSRRGTHSQHPRDDDDDDNDDDDDGGDDDKVSGGSEWIMHLIAKKRAKLRIAKHARRKQKYLRRHRKKAQHILRSFSTSRRRYLYHPEGQNPGEERDGGSEATSSVDVSRGTSHHTTYHRRYMAPYTIMMVHNTQPESEPESDDQEEANASDTDEEAQPANQEFITKSEDTENGKRLWSSDSDSSSDNEVLPTKRSRTSFSNSDSDSDSDGSQDRKNGHFISEIMDSNASDSDIEKQVQVVEVARSSERNLNAEGSSNRSNGLPDILNDATLSEKSFGDSNGIHDITNELNISSTVSDAIPISSISSDDNGSLLFETDHGSLVSGFDLSNSLDVAASATTAAPRKIIQNGSSQTTNGTTSGNTTENGIIVIPSSAEKTDEETMNGNEIDSGISINGTDAGSANASFKFKKRMPSCNLRNYRRRTGDDL